MLILLSLSNLLFNLLHRSDGDKIDGNMEYNFQDGDSKKPTAFLNKLKIM